MEKSKGHIGISEYDGAKTEWYTNGHDVFRASVTSALDRQGYRIGRWECSFAHYKRWKKDCYQFVMETENAEAMGG